jgi:serine/threonine-protein phosphatase 6 regulatory ankyrin repeat subunit B
MDYKKTLFNYIIIKLALMCLIVLLSMQMRRIIGSWYYPASTLEQVEEQLRNGVDPDERDALGMSPLMSAAVSDSPQADVSYGLQLANLLLKYGADVDAQATYDRLMTDNQGNTALHFATLNAFDDMTKLLLEYGADPLIVNTFGDTPLHLMAYIGIGNFDEQQRIFELLMKYGSNPNIQNSQGSTALHLLIEGNSVQLAQALLTEYGAIVNPNLKNSAGLTQIELSKALGRDDMTQLMLALNNTTLGLNPIDVDVNIKNNQGYAGVNLAALLGDVEYMKKLVARHADLGLRGPKTGDTPLYTAARFNFVPLVRFLIDNKAPADAVNNLGHTIPMALLGILSLDQRMQFLITVLNHGANINAKDITGNTMLHYAVLRHDVPWIARLVKRFGDKLDISIKNNSGLTAIDIAKRKKYDDIVALFK